MGMMELDEHRRVLGQAQPSTSSAVPQPAEEPVMMIHPAVRKPTSAPHQPQSLALSLTRSHHHLTLVMPPMKPIA